MAVITEKFSITSKGEDIVDITSKIVEFIRNLDIENALLNIYVKSENSSLIVSEYEIMKKTDIFSLLKSLTNSPSKIDISENDLKINASTKAKFLSNSLTIPVIAKRIQIEDYQKIFVLDFSYNISICDIIISVVN